eukprot:UC1_evm3s1801
MGAKQSVEVTVTDGPEPYQVPLGRLAGSFAGVYMGSIEVDAKAAREQEAASSAVDSIRGSGAASTRKIKLMLGSGAVSAVNPSTKVQIAGCFLSHVTGAQWIPASTVVVWTSRQEGGRKGDPQRLYAVQFGKAALAAKALNGFGKARTLAAKHPYTAPNIPKVSTAKGVGVNSRPRSESTASMASVSSTDSSGGTSSSHNALRKRTESMRVAPSVAELPEDIFKVTYLGSTPVSEKGGAATVQAASEDLRKQKRPKRKALLGISAEAIRLRDAKTDEVLQTSPLAQLTFATGDARNNAHVAYITDALAGLFSCHCIKAKSASVGREITTAIGTALVTAANARKAAGGKAAGAGLSAEARALARSVTMGSKKRGGGGGGGGGGNNGGKGGGGVADLSAPLGLYQATYLASVHVESASANKQQVCCDAAFSLVQGPPPETLVGQEVAISVSGEGLRVIETQTVEVLQNVGLKNISYISSLDDKRLLKALRKGGLMPKELPIFAFISTDVRLKRRRCELFYVAERAGEVCDAMKQAFELAKAEAARLKANPFAAIDKKRERVTGPLFKRQIHRRDLKARSVIGMGQFGEVWSAEQSVLVASKTPGGQPERRNVLRAVKLLRDGASSGDRTEFLREAETMLDLDHPNLVSLVGVSVQQRPWMVVLEYMEYGDLRAVLQTCQEKQLKLTFMEQLKFCVQIATGMDYLSSRRFVHMDLAARNCLLGRHCLVKIADFGLTQQLDEGEDHYQLKQTLKLPIKWMAPESMDLKMFSRASDVWAFGITLWEIMSYGSTPYSDIRNIEVQPKVRDGYRLPQPKDCPPEFYAVMGRCWDAKWLRRPSFKDLRQMVLRIASKAKKTSPPLRDIGMLLSAGEAAAATAAAVAAAAASDTAESKVEDNADFTESGPKRSDDNVVAAATSNDGTGAEAEKAAATAREGEGGGEGEEGEVSASQVAGHTGGGDAKAESAAAAVVVAGTTSNNAFTAAAAAVDKAAAAGAKTSSKEEEEEEKEEKKEEEETEEKVEASKPQGSVGAKEPANIAAAAAAAAAAASDGDATNPFLKLADATTLDNSASPPPSNTTDVASVVVPSAGEEEDKRATLKAKLEARRKAKAEAAAAATAAATAAAAAVATAAASEPEPEPEPEPETVSATVQEVVVLEPTSRAEGSASGPAAWYAINGVDGVGLSAHVTDNGAGAADSVVIRGRVAF